MNALATPEPPPLVFSVETIEAALRDGAFRKPPGCCRYREIEPGIYELLDEAGAVVAWADRAGVHRLEEAGGQPDNSLQRLFGRGTRVFILPERLAVLRAGSRS
jgi:hypothetical protein